MNDEANFFLQSGKNKFSPLHALKVNCIRSTHFTVRREKKLCVETTKNKNDQFHQQSTVTLFTHVQPENTERICSTLIL